MPNIPNNDDGADGDESMRLPRSFDESMRVMTNNDCHAIRLRSTPRLRAQLRNVKR